MKKNPLVLLLILTFTMCGGAQAGLIAYEFDVSFDTGTLSGQTFTGVLEVEAPPDPPDGNYNPDNLVKKLVSFEIEVDGAVFVMEDDIEFGLAAFPAVEFDAAGVLTDILYIGVNSNDDYLSILFDASRNEVEFGSAFDTGLGSPADPPEYEFFVDAEGTVTRTSRVPEPTTLALMGLGLAGIGYRRRRSKIAV